MPKPCAEPHPCGKRQAVRKRLGEAPGCGKRPEREEHKTGEHHRRREPHQEAGRTADEGVTARPPSRAGKAAAETDGDALPREPDEERHAGDADLQHRAGGGDEMHGEIGIVLPVDDADGKRRRRRRPEDQRHIDDGGREGEHRKHRQPELPVERRQHRMDEADDPPIAERRDHALHLRGARLRQRRKRHQEEEGDLLHDEAEDHGKPEPVLHDQEIGRALPTRERPDEAEEKSGRRDQEGEPEGSRRMRHAQERRDEAFQRAKGPRAAPAGDKEHHDGESDGRRGKPGREAEERRVEQARLGEECVEGAERELPPAKRRQITEGRKRNPEKAGRDRHDQQGKRGQRKEPQHGSAYWFTP